MASTEDILDFCILERDKENIQSLPGGRSARALARQFSPQTPVTLEETKTLNDAIRKEYEIELQSIDDQDDPLDCYSRYVKWTLDAYPSAQSTSQSQLLPLLERATKAFLTYPEYKDDPRYLKLWLHYIRFFSDTPRETFAFLARHSIGEHLALFYEEFAAWLEGAGRWNQADEVYKLGIEREARPAERLMRKYTQFQQRFEARAATSDEPSSPALPRVRAALAAKVDPFAPAPREEPQQQSRPTSSTSTAKPKKQKMAIFSDAESQPPPPATSITDGWDSIDSIKERKKENTVEARPWAGETLKAGKRVGTATKMEVFKDPQNEISKSRVSRQPDPVVNPRTGRSERVFVNMNAVYAEDGTEFSFEELRARGRGWSDIDWKHGKVPVLRENANARTEQENSSSREPEDVENLTCSFEQKLDITESSNPSQEVTKEGRTHKQKKIKVREVKQETQTVKTRLDSPSRPKMRKKASAEPTMTFNSKAAHNDIYNMYNNASRTEARDDTQSGAETDIDDDTFSMVGEGASTALSVTNSEMGDDTVSSIRSFGADDTSNSPWSDFTTGKISKVLKKARSTKHKRVENEDFTNNMTLSQDQAQDGFDTQAIADLANQDFGELDTMAIARIAGDVEEDDVEKEAEEKVDEKEDTPSEPLDSWTPVEAAESEGEVVEVKEKPRYVPIPPEDYEPTPLRPYRDPNFVAHHKLPFMTPIVEQTESSLAASTIYHSHFEAVKTPSRTAEGQPPSFESPSRLQIVDLLLDSPQPNSIKRKKDVEEEDDAQSPKRIIAESPTIENQKILFPVMKPSQPATKKEDIGVVDSDIFRTPSIPSKPAQVVKRSVHKGPIIHDLQCNPCDESVIQQILETVHPAPASYQGFHEYEHASRQFSHIRSYAQKVAKMNSKTSPRKTPKERTSLVPPILNFGITNRVYAIKRELGEGAFAPVYLVESSAKGENAELIASNRGEVEAIKVEDEPKTLAWEFHILHLLRTRLGRSSRSMESIILAHECHLYRDECYLVLDYHPQGTLLDLVNLCRNENIRAGKSAEGLEEPVAMWLAVELLRTVEDMHKVGILHGDLKADNCLVRLDTETELTEPYNRHGDNGWSKKGLTLIDLGRGVDTKAFKPEARFIADWKAEETDCPEIREAKPWKWEIDLFGTAGVIHSLLFGKYIDTVSVSGGGLGQKKEWKLRENFKRYWEKDIWADLFSTLINGGGKKDEEARKDLQRIRYVMEDWLEREGERNGRDLRGALRRCERLIGAGNGSKNRR